VGVGESFFSSFSPSPYSLQAQSPYVTLTRTMQGENGLSAHQRSEDVPLSKERKRCHLFYCDSDILRGWLVQNCDADRGIMQIAF
jgi:hypothetical protein